MPQVSLCILVREQVALSQLGRQGAEILTRYQLELTALIAQLSDDGRGDGGSRRLERVEPR